MMIIAIFAASLARAEVVVFAAASLKEPVDKLAQSFGGVVVSYGGSGMIARQVTLGAPADVVLLANADWMDFLEKEGFVDPAGVKEFASNRLVVIGPPTADDVVLTPAGISAALGRDRLAIGLTGAVPAGIYAKAALVQLDLWDAVSDQLAEVDNVRAALALVARGQAPLGIVYATDARVSTEVRIVAEVPASAHPPIGYVGAVTDGAAERAGAFWTYLHGPEGRAALDAAGFLPARGKVE